MHATNQMTLGGMIDALSKMPPSINVVYDGISPKTNPRNLYSYRGYYKDLAIGFSPTKSITVSDLLNLLKSAIGDMFIGYKGGAFTMNESTLMWASEYGINSQLSIVGVVKDGEEVKILLADTSTK